MFSRILIFAAFYVFEIFQVVQSAKCDFMTVDTAYVCELHTDDIFSEADMQEIKGNHVPGLGNVDVTHLTQKNIKISQFPSLIVDKFVNLYSINLVNASMESLVTPITYCEKLEYIYLTFNEITSIPSGIFHNCRELIYLDISWNHISQIHDNALVGLTKLQTLRLNENKIQTLTPEVLTPVPNLLNLKLSNNLLEEIRATMLEKVKKLQTLDLEFNKISYWDEVITESVSDLTVLALRGNLIESITSNTFVNLYKIQFLSIGKLLKTLPKFSFYPNLQFLILEGNQLETITGDIFANLPAIEALDLQQNKIKSIRFEPLFQTNLMPKLENLALDHNLIKDLNEDSFYDFKSLKTLTMRNNQLTKLEEKVFKKVFPLETFDVRYNQISEIDRNIFEGVEGMTFLAEGNMCTTEDLLDAEKETLLTKFEPCFKGSGVSFKVSMFLIVTAFVFNIFQM